MSTFDERCNETAMMLALDAGCAWGQAALGHLNLAPRYREYEKRLELIRATACEIELQAGWSGIHDGLHIEVVETAADGVAERWSNSSGFVALSDEAREIAAAALAHAASQRSTRS